MNQEIYNKIEEIFSIIPQNEDTEKLKKEVIFDFKKHYNQMLQSGFSEYIAVAESLDNLEKIKNEIDTTNPQEIRKKLLLETFKDNIKNTTAKCELNDEYDKDSINKIIQLVEGAALESENLQSTDIKEQSDEIVYKKDLINNENFAKETINQPNNQNEKVFNKKRYFTRLISFISVLGITALVVILLHIYKVF